MPVDAGDHRVLIVPTAIQSVIQTRSMPVQLYRIILPFIVSKLEIILGKINPISGFFFGLISILIRVLYLEFSKFFPDYRELASKNLKKMLGKK
jgi:hypothetical protein